MNNIANNLDMFNCCMCFEPMKSAVSLNPCGHELDEGCANAILSSTKNCPICRVDVDSFRPAYITRQAVELLLQNMQQPDVIIHVNRLTGARLTYKMKRDSKTIDLYKRIFTDTGTPPSMIQLMNNAKLVSHFNHLSEYIQLNEVELSFNMKLYMGHWKTGTAKSYPLIFQKAVSEVGSNNDELLYGRFMSLYNQAIAEAMNS